MEKMPFINDLFYEPFFKDETGFKANLWLEAFFIETKPLNFFERIKAFRCFTGETNSALMLVNLLVEAKKNNRPIVSVNCLQVYEDRIFPPAANVPCVHIAPSDKPTKLEILNILVAALIETIRFNFSISLLNYYKKQSWIDSTAVVLARPPEIQQIVSLRSEMVENETLKICYPEPPIYAEEMDWLEFLKVKPSTPLWTC